MRTVTKAKILNFLGLFNIVRDVIYRRDLSNVKVLNFYKFVNEGSLCFDVGANIGRVTDILLRRGARVVAVEPNPDCVRYLKSKYRSNNKVVVIPKALDAGPGTKKLYICEVNSLSTIAPDWIKACKDSQRYSEFDWNREVDVEVTTLDDLIKIHGRPDYLKVDVEGNEANVLKGLSQSVPLVSLELCPETMASTQNCIKTLASLGDRFFNLSFGESAEKFELTDWISSIDMAAFLKERPRHGYLWARSASS